MIDHQTVAEQQIQLEEATVSDVGGMSDVSHPLLYFSFVFVNAEYGNYCHHVAKGPQSKWPRASTVSGPMVQVGNNLMLFVC